MINQPQQKIAGGIVWRALGDEFVPTNSVIHCHDDFPYEYCLRDGKLWRANSDRMRYAHSMQRWMRGEFVLPQTEVEYDPEGTACPIDPARESYIAALTTVLQTTEPTNEMLKAAGVQSDD